MSTSKNNISTLAHSLGFVRIGFAKAEPFTKEYDHYKKWLADGMNAGMEWMETTAEKRADVSRVLDGAKTVIMTAYNYFTPFRHEVTYSPGKGKLSRYAWGSEYQAIILPKLKQVCAAISETHRGSNSVCYVDTGSVLEKQWAVRAGIGWQGKSGLIITKEYGSWIFLGTIITDVEFEPDYPIKNYCGSCTLCMDSCPTGALVRPSVLDARKCLSYWTIEASPDREIPSVVANKAQGWIYGCDACQNVCPWNMKQAPTKEELFRPRDGETCLDPRKILAMTKEEFSERFRKSSLKRLKPEGLARNIRDILKIKAG